MKISAVIVTYNRLADLKKCIEAVQSQTIGCDIIVVNNGSTDGTSDYLKSLSGIELIEQGNLGGAGGFFSGTKYAYDKGYDWVWLMDDDGIPENTQLEVLFRVSTINNLKVANALVVNKEDHSRFAFGKQELLTTVDLSNDFISEPLSPFNGTFIHREVMAKVGFIKKEMFIWGDEQEYMARIRKGGYTPYTITKAIHYHPREKGVKLYALPALKIGQVMEKPIKLSHYYYRNLGYLCWNYRGIKVTIKNFCYYNIFLLRKFRFRELSKFNNYYFKGILNDYK